MLVVTDLTSWAQRATDPDPVLAAEVWTDPSAPAAALHPLPEAVLNYLLGDGASHGTLAAVLRNPALPHTALATLAARAKGESRAKISRHVLHNPENVPQLIAAAPAITSAELSKAVNSLRFGWWRRQDPDAAAALLATLLRAFTSSPNVRCRALAAQTFPLSLGQRHRYADGEVSATKLAADTETAVLVALARNHHLRALPETDDGLTVRRVLLENPAPRVRAAARRAGVHVLNTHIHDVFAAAHGHPATPDSVAPRLGLADPLDDPAPSVRVTAVVNGIHQRDGARWARVLADPSPQVRKVAATHGHLAPSFVWDGLAADPDPGVRAAVAGSRWAPPELQRRLLSDASPKVAAAANGSDPLSRPVRVRPTMPADAEIMLPVSYTHDEQIHLLDLTVATLTLPLQHLLAIAARTDAAERARARDRVITRLGTSRPARWIVNRWERWSDVFAVPAPADSMIWWERKVAAPFAGARDADDRVTGALVLFDAALGLAATPGALPATSGPDVAEPEHPHTITQARDQDLADLALLVQPWEQVLLPTRVTDDTVYGPHTPAARLLLTTAARLPRTRLHAALTTRIGIDDQLWSTARREAIEVAAGPHAHLYAAHVLFWDAVAVAELAAGQRPTDPLLADALWGSVAVTLYGQYLAPGTVDILSRPGAAAGLTSAG